MTEKVSDGLLALRTEIDKIDRELQVLLNRRAGCALKVAEVKSSETAGGGPVLFYRPEREAQVLRDVMQRNEGPLGGETVARLFREIMSACLALEEPMKIGFLGPAGTFTQEAALKHFGHGVVSVSFSSIDAVFREVEAGSVNYGVVPVENSTEGVVNHTLDSFFNSTLKVCGEVELRIHHHLLIPEGRSNKEIKKIYSHQQSLAQCRSWLDGNWPKVERVAVSSNAEAARLAAKEEGAAAIA
ncbi:MAG: chorismate mutase, partial [Pseudomonadales bacterium]|nr:chorismate mutase [Pseudomonadales bacterium]